MVEKSLPNLVVSRKEASKKIEEQIEKGKQLRNREIHLSEDLQKAEEDSYNWSKGNEILLLKLFDNRLILDMYENFQDYRSDLHVAESHSSFKGMIHSMLKSLVITYQTRMDKSIYSLVFHPFSN